MYDYSRSIRLQGYDYTRPGYYFITICVSNKLKCLSEINNGRLILSDLGKIILTLWNSIPDHYEHFGTDEFIIMPNHIHGILIIKSSENIISLEKVVRSFKSLTAKEINHRDLSDSFKWQTSFYDHVIRNEESLKKIRQYIIDNPLKWHLDKYNK